MKGQAFQTRDQLATAYLQHLQELAVELDVAMDAVATNALTGLEESVSKQEMLCANLARMAKAMGDESELFAQPLPASLDAGVEEKIWITKGAIRDLNLQYAALLKHSGNSIALLASLCRSHSGQFQETHGPGLKHQTWSCEV